MRVLFIGDMAPTGFGTVTKDLGLALLERGDDVRFMSHYSVGQAEESAEPFRSRTLNITTFVVTDEGVSDINVSMQALFAGTTPGRFVSGQAWGSWIPEGVIILGDYAAAWLIVSEAMEAFQAFDGWIGHYIPVEGVDLPPAWKALWDVVTPIAMSKFGQTEIAKVTGVVPPLAYHGVDTEAFHPVSAEQPIILANADGDAELTTKADCKRAWMGYFDTPQLGNTWILRTDRHMPRKRHNALIRAAAPVLVQHPEAVLILHCAARDQGGFLPWSISKTGMLGPWEQQPIGTPMLYAFPGRTPQIIVTNAPGLSRTQLVSLYNAADVYASNSAEGFGLTIAESLACGVPALGIDYSAVPEVIGPAGRTVPVAHLEDNVFDHCWAAVHEGKYAYWLEKLVNSQPERERLGALGPPHVRETFSWTGAARVFGALIESATQEDQSRAPSRLASGLTLSEEASAGSGPPRGIPAATAPSQ